MATAKIWQLIYSLHNSVGFFLYNVHYQKNRILTNYVQPFGFISDVEVILADLQLTVQKEGVLPYVWEDLRARCGNYDHLRIS